MRSGKEVQVRTKAFQFTTEDRNDPRISELKNKIRFVNKLSREATRHAYYNKHVHALWRVRLMPRGARVEAAWTDFKSRRAYDSYLPIRHGTRFDVYVHRDTTGEWMMQRELDTGLSQGQLRYIDRERDELRKQEWEMRKKFQAQGFWEIDGVWVEKSVAMAYDKANGLPEQWIERKYKN